MKAEQLTTKHCVPCEGGIPALTPEQTADYLKAVPEWQLAADNKRIARKWKFKNFVAGLDFVQRIGAVAEQENHHPDLHLTGYRHVTVELTTHAINGLSENDFILAAKIDRL